MEYNSGFKGLRCCLTETFET